MRRRSPADVHQSILAFVARHGLTNADAIVMAWGGSGWHLIFFAVGPLGQRIRYLAAVDGKTQIWNWSTEGLHLSEVFERPTAVVSTGRRYDNVEFDGRKFLTDKSQRPYLLALLESTSTLPTTGMAGRPAGWYPNPWAFPGLGGQLRYWDGSQWTGHTHPASDRPGDPGVGDGGNGQPP